MVMGRLESRLFSTRGVSYIVGGGLMAFGGLNTYNFYRSKHWPRVDGRILGMYPYSAWQGDDKLRYTVDYEFDFHGEKRYGVQVETGSMWRWWMGDVARDTMGSNEIRKGRLRPGGLVKVFVDPNNESRCGLYRTGDSTRNGIMMGVGGTLIIGAILCFPKNHRFEMVNKLRWFVRYRMMFHTGKTRLVDVVFDRAPDAPLPAYKQAGYTANVSMREKLGLDGEQWDADVQQKRKERLAKEAEAAAAAVAAESAVPQVSERTSDVRAR